MKKLILLSALLLGAYVTASAQQKNGNRRPVTEKEKKDIRQIKSEPTAEGRENQQKAQEDIRRHRAEKRAKLEEAKKEARERVAIDTSSTKKR